MKTLVMAIVAMAMLTQGFSYAQQPEQVVPEALQQLSLGGTAVTPSAINETAVPGWYEVRLTTGETFYSDAEARFVLVGKLLENRSDRLVDLTELSQRTANLEALDQLPDMAFVTYPASGDEIGTITVFTDTTCPYCQRLHQDIGALNDAGITVLYLPFPRTGMTSSAALQLADIWCSDNPRQALTAAFHQYTTNTSTGAEACRDEVASGYTLGLKLGIRGTPAIMLPSGELGAGYMPVDQIVQAVKPVGSSGERSDDRSSPGGVR